MTVSDGKDESKQYRCRYCKHKPFKRLHYFQMHLKAKHAEDTNELMTDLDVMGPKHQRQPLDVVQRPAESRGAPHHPYLVGDAFRSHSGGMDEPEPPRHALEVPQAAWSIQPTRNERYLTATPPIYQNEFLRPEVQGWSPASTSSSVCNSPGPTPPASPGEVEGEAPQDSSQNVQFGRHTPSHAGHSRSQFFDPWTNPVPEEVPVVSSYPHQLQQGRTLDVTDPAIYECNTSSLQSGLVVPAITLIPATPNLSPRDEGRSFQQETDLGNFTPGYLAEEQIPTPIHNYSDQGSRSYTPVEADTHNLDGNSSQHYMNSHSSMLSSTKRKPDKNDDSSTRMKRNKAQRGTRIAKAGLPIEQSSGRVKSEANDPELLAADPNPSISTDGSTPSVAPLPPQFSFRSYAPESYLSSQRRIPLARSPDTTDNGWEDSMKVVDQAHGNSGGAFTVPYYQQVPEQTAEDAAPLSSYDGLDPVVYADQYANTRSDGIQSGPSTFLPQSQPCPPISYQPPLSSYDPLVYDYDADNYTNTHSDGIQSGPSTFLPQSQPHSISGSVADGYIVAATSVDHIVTPDVSEDWPTSTIMADSAYAPYEQGLMSNNDYDLSSYDVPPEDCSSEAFDDAVYARSMESVDVRDTAGIEMGDFPESFDQWFQSRFW